MGRYFTNREMRAINRQLSNKNGCRNGGCGCVILIVVAIFGIGVLSKIPPETATQPPTAATKPTANPNTAEDEPQPETEHATKEISKKTLVFPSRSWTDAFDKKTTGKFQKVIADEVFIRSNKGAKKYPLGAFSAKDVGYVEEIEALPEKIAIYTDTPSRCWTYFEKNETFEGHLEYAGEFLLIILVDSRHEVHQRQDFVFQDLEYLSNF